MGFIRHYILLLFLSVTFMGSTQTEAHEEEVTMAVQNAGVVILTPYLETLFSRAGFLDVDGFLTNENKSKAVMLLQYAVTGTEDAQEHELVLNKVLCGMAGTEPVDTSIELTTEQKALVDSMLQAVIANWEKLGDTSVNGLRNSFLIRDGLLVFKNTTFILSVSRRGLDILLDFIPWGFRIVNFKWMDMPVHTEW